jgi:membrane-associated phospholipid phosphatase
MSKRTLAITAALCAAVSLISIFTVDQAIAMAVHNSGFENAAFFVDGRSFLDVFTGRGLVGSHVGLGQFLLGSVFIVVGIVWWLARRSSLAARGIVFAGVVQLVTIELAWLIKDVFGRMRPFQLIENNDWSHMWFMDSNSFPSGHNAFFWGLFLPLIYAFPRYRIPLLIVPVFIALARIDENYHFLSDVLASIALAALVTLVAATFFGRWLRPRTTLGLARVTGFPLSRE